MKKKVLVLTTLLVCSAPIINAQFAFSVRPGFQLNGASFGQYNEKMVYYCGLQFGNASIKYEDDLSDSKIKLHLFMPFIGAKFYVAKKDPVRTSININVFKPFIFGKAIEDGQVDNTFGDDINKIGIWGGQMGFETEYYFHESFSIGGEFGIRLGNYRYEETEDSDYKDVVNLNMTYVAISLNFYL